MTQLTKEQAIAFAEARKWESLTLNERADFQLSQTCLCMPFNVFHEAVEVALDRPVYTHEFANSDELRTELKMRLNTTHGRSAERPGDLRS